MVRDEARAKEQLHNKSNNNNSNSKHNEMAANPLKQYLAVKLQLRSSRNFSSNINKTHQGFNTEDTYRNLERQQQPPQAQKHERTKSVAIFPNLGSWVSQWSTVQSPSRRVKSMFGGATMNMSKVLGGSSLAPFGDDASVRGRQFSTRSNMPRPRR